MGILNQLRGQSTAGIVPRAVEHIFESEQMLPTGNVTVSMSFLQIYNNSIQDLISDSAQMESNLPLREGHRRALHAVRHQRLQAIAVRDREFLNPKP